MESPKNTLLGEGVESDSPQKMKDWVLATGFCVKNRRQGDRGFLGQDFDDSTKITSPGQFLVQHLVSSGGGVCVGDFMKKILSELNLNMKVWDVTMWRWI